MSTPVLHPGPGTLLTVAVALAGAVCSSAVPLTPMAPTIVTVPLWDGTVAPAPTADRWTSSAGEPGVEVRHTRLLRHSWTHCAPM